MIKITLNAYPPPAPVVQKKSNQIEFKDTQNLNDFNSEKEKSSGPKGGQRPPVAAAAAAATTTASDLANQIDENLVLENGSSTETTTNQKTNA